MARPIGVTTLTSDRPAPPAPDVIDRLLRHIRSLAAASEDAQPNRRVPAKQDIYKLAEAFGLRVRRGGGANDSDVPIPDYYSEREARLAVARNVARVGIDRMKNQCHVNGRSKASPANDVCNLVTAPMLDQRSLDSIAAAMLMPTQDFTHWARKLRCDEELLADSYAVPIDLARIRLEELEPLEGPAN